MDKAARLRVLAKHIAEQRQYIGGNNTLSRSGDAFKTIAECLAEMADILADQPPLANTPHGA